MSTELTKPDLFDIGHVIAGGGWDLDRGFLIRRDLVVNFMSKAEAVTVARSIGWSPNTVEQSYNRFISRFYTLHSPQGGFLTPLGLAAIRLSYSTVSR